MRPPARRHPSGSWHRACGRAHACATGSCWGRRTGAPRSHVSTDRRPGAEGRLAPPCSVVRASLRCRRGPFRSRARVRRRRRARGVGRRLRAPRVLAVPPGGWCPLGRGGRVARARRRLRQRPRRALAGARGARRSARVHRRRRQRAAARAGARARAAGRALRPGGFRHDAAGRRAARRARSSWWRSSACCTRCPVTRAAARCSKPRRRAPRRVACWRSRAGASTRAQTRKTHRPLGALRRAGRHHRSTRASSSRATTCSRFGAHGALRYGHAIDAIELQGAARGAAARAARGLVRRRPGRAREPLRAAAAGRRDRLRCPRGCGVNRAARPRRRATIGRAHAPPTKAPRLRERGSCVGIGSATEQGDAA